MATTSIVETVIGALITQLQAQSGLSGVNVSDTPPPDLKREEVYVSNIQLAHRSPTLMGAAARQSRHETVTLTITAIAGKPGQTGTAARQRAVALMSCVEDVIATNRQLGGTLGIKVAAPFHVWADPAPDEGWVGGAQLVIEYTAWLS